jgi:hypothetical protein
MFEYLDRLREKPIGARKRIAFFSTVSIFSVIVLVWWTTFTNPLDSGVIKASDNVATPIEVMGGMFKQVKDGAKQLPVQISDYLENVATSTKGGEDSSERVDARDLMNATSSADVAAPTPAPEPTPLPQAVTPTKAAPAPETQTRATQVPPPAPLVSPKPPQPPPPPANLIPTRPGTISASNG